MVYSTEAIPSDFFIRLHLYLCREELAIIENRILEKNLAAKKKAEKRAKNIAVSRAVENQSLDNLQTLKLLCLRSLL